MEMPAFAVQGRMTALPTRPRGTGICITKTCRASLPARPRAETLSIASAPSRERRPDAASGPSTSAGVAIPLQGMNSIAPFTHSSSSLSEQPEASTSDHTPALATPAANGRKPKLRVAVDVDEVLGRFLHCLNRFKLERYGVDFQISDYDVYNFAKVWQCSADESNHIVHEFFQSHHFSQGIPPIPGAFETLQRLAGSWDLVVVTSRQHVIREPTLEWIDNHFPDIFAEVHFGNHFALEGISKKKSVICREIGAEVLIDDNPQYAVECATAGIQVLLYDWQLGYPWSKTADGPEHPNIRRVRDWIDVETALTQLHPVPCTS